MPDILRDLLRLDFLGDPVTAATKLEREDCVMMGEVLFTDDGFFPDSSGWPYKLPDGVETFLRFRKTDDICQAEWCIANRDVEVPDEFSLELAAERLTKVFGADHRVFSSLRMRSNCSRATKPTSTFLWLKLGKMKTLGMVRKWALALGSLQC